MNKKKQENNSLVLTANNEKLQSALASVRNELSNMQHQSFQKKKISLGQQVSTLNTELKSNIEKQSQIA